MKFIFSWKKDFAALTREIFFRLEDKLHMFAPPCNILYLLHGFKVSKRERCVLVLARNRSNNFPYIIYLSVTWS